jgi:hypothetical protein
VPDGFFVSYPGFHSSELQNNPKDQQGQGCSEDADCQSHHQCNAQRGEAIQGFRVRRLFVHQIISKGEAA